MQQVIKNFDFSKFSFHGSSLIEASAGTGKTHIIVMLYLRLLLGISNRRDIQILTIEKILVVTFTRKAVEELRERIRRNIHEFRFACLVGHSKNIFFSKLLEQVDDLYFAYKRLLIAEQNINKAQIFTIHGFCQHMLNIYPIELYTTLQYTILEDERHILQKSCNDFWRRYFYHLPIEIIYIIKEYWNTPKNLFIEIYPYLYNQEIKIKPTLKEDILVQHDHIINYINYVKKLWNEGENKLFDHIENFSFNRYVYNKKNLLNWFKSINLWAKDKITKNYMIPKALKRFRYSIIIKNLYIDTNKISGYLLLLKSIEILFKKIELLKQLILNIAIHEVREIAKRMKFFSSEISFNDLICLLDDALQHPNTGKKLAQIIRKDYPVIIIDEFQDTDFQQYRIFRTLYSQFKDGLLLIGDPKQSIYSFRGADIFSYLLASKDIDFKYTLNINWRSSKGMVNAVNTLFQFNSNNPFILKNISFSSVQSEKNCEELRLVVKNKLFPALSFCLPSCDKLSLYEYQRILANQCAYVIRDLLYGACDGYVWLKNKKSKKKLQASDIVILVRNRSEGLLISSVLEKLNIMTTYSSNQENIFQTNESVDVLLILEAVLSPDNDNTLRCALMTNIIGYNSEKIDLINNNENDWKKEFEEFNNYYIFWEKYGIQVMLREILFRRFLLKNLLCTSEGEQCLINILHLGEVLQKKSLELNNKNSLISWLSMKINSCHEFSNDQLLQMKSSFQFVKIMTVHKAKGLEFPLVFLPFVSIPHKRKYPIFHDRENYQICLDLNNFSESFYLSEEEKLSEDLRILYVAITRAIYYCFIGIGAIFLKKNTKKEVSDLHLTALGYLIQNGIPGNFQFLQECLKKLVKCSNEDIVCDFICAEKNQLNVSLITNRISNSNFIDSKNLSAKNWKVLISDLYKVTSYTELKRFNKSPISTLNSNFREIIFQKHDDIQIKDDNILLNSHTFPRGHISGDFLHYIFQKWDFKEKINDEWLTEQLYKKGLDIIWLPIVQSWMKMVVSTPLNNKDLILSKLSSVNCSSELQFYLSVSNLVSSEKFDSICKRYDLISRFSSTLKFSNILGMLHGFIDLVFLWKGKYYLLDYKSNWLGSTYDNYVISFMENAMITNQYALQYQIYTLALHRILRNKLIGYNYEKDFGGVYYLFLRGINIMYPGCGVYFCRPSQLLINELDKLLS